MQHESNSTYSQYWKILRKTVGRFISDMLIIGKTWNKVLRQFALTYCWLSVGPDQNFFATVDQTSGFLKLPPPSSTICPTAPHKETTSLILTLPTIHQPPNNPPTIQQPSQPSSLQHIIMQQSVSPTHLLLKVGWYYEPPNLTLKPLFFSEIEFSSLTCHPYAFCFENMHSQHLQKSLIIIAFSGVTG